MLDLWKEHWPYVDLALRLAVIAPLVLWFLVRNKIILRQRRKEGSWPFLP